MTFSRADRALRVILYAVIAGGTALATEGAHVLSPLALLYLKVVLASSIAIRAYIDQSGRKHPGGDA